MARKRRTRKQPPAQQAQLASTDAIPSEQRPIFGGFAGVGGQDQAMFNADVMRAIGRNPIGEWLAEYLYCYSWAAAKLVDLPVNDIWRNGRRWIAEKDSEQSAVDAMVEEEDRLNAHKTISEAMKAARLFGSAAIIALVEGQDPAQELDVKSVGKEKLKTLLIRNRYSLAVDSVIGDPFMDDYGKPGRYRVSLPTLEGYGTGAGANGDRIGAMSDSIRELVKDGQILVHASRVFRFDGHNLPGGTRFATRTYNADWGESMLTRLMAALLRDESAQDSFGDLVKESSIFTISVDGLRDMIKGRVHRGEPTVEEIAQSISKYRNNYRTLFLDAGDDAERIAVAFSGAADMMDRFATRLAMIADIPATRFLAKAPDGMNATGHGDNANYQLTLTSMRQEMLEDLLPRFDELLAASAGIGEAPEYQWEDTFTMDPEKVAKNAEVQASAVIAAITAGVVTATEGRELLPETWFGSLGPMPAELKRMEEVHGEKEEAELANLMNEGEDDDDGPPSKSKDKPKGGGPSGKPKPKGNNPREKK